MYKYEFCTQCCVANQLNFYQHQKKAGQMKPVKESETQNSEIINVYGHLITHRGHTDNVMIGKCIKVYHEYKQSRV